MIFLKQYFQQTLFSIFLLVIPEIVFSTEKSLTIKAGENIKIQCSISGRPLPQVAWYKDGKELDKMLVEIITNVGSSSLFLRDADRNDRGVYTVEAKNSSGTMKEDVLVRVQGLYLHIITVTNVFVWLLFCNWSCFVVMLYITYTNIIAVLFRHPWIS